MLRERHCKRNGSCIGEQKHGKERDLKNLGHIRAIFTQFSRDLRTNGNYMRMRLRHANETCKYARKFNNF